QDQRQGLGGDHAGHEHGALHRGAGRQRRLHRRVPQQRKPGQPAPRHGRRARRHDLLRSVQEHREGGRERLGARAPDTGPEEARDGDTLGGAGDGSGPTRKGERRMTPTLHARDLCKRFGSKEAVRDVRVAVGPGEVVGLLGPNGAGKTTTFNMIVGRVHPTAGRVYLGEEEITDLPMYQRARKGITYLPQEPSIFRKLTVEENILAILETLPMRRHDRRERAKELLGELDLVAKRKQKGATLSGGE